MRVVVPSAGRPQATVAMTAQLRQLYPINYLVPAAEAWAYHQALTPLGIWPESIGPKNPRGGKAAALDYWRRHESVGTWCLVLDDDIFELLTFTGRPAYMEHFEWVIREAERLMPGVHLIGLRPYARQRTDAMRKGYEQPFERLKTLVGQAFLWKPRFDMPVPIRHDDDRWLTFEHAWRDGVCARTNLLLVNAGPDAAIGGHGDIWNRELQAHRENEAMYRRYGSMVRFAHTGFYPNEPSALLNEPLYVEAHRSVHPWTPYKN